MAVNIGTILAIVVPTIIGIIGAIAPLYYMVLRLYGDRGTAAMEREGLDAEQTTINEKLDRIESNISSLDADVRMNAQAAERNQKHIHQLLVGRMNADEDDDIGNPHYKSEYCPLPEECPYHSPDG
jgi:nitrogen fixation/metabolism regulation signal transduction histidine kinase